MEVGILGPVEVHEGTQIVPVGGNIERAVLAVLALNANHVVSTDRLVDDVWDSEPPATAIASLQVRISRLRKALGDFGPRIVTQTPGYQLVLEAHELDVNRFNRRAQEGRDARRAGDVERASGLLTEALAVWRGPALADFSDRAFARSEVARLEESRLAALEDRIAADLAAGRHAVLIGELECLTETHAFRERLWCHRLLALYRSGRQADALRTYQDVRTLLGDELGIDPGPDLRRLEKLILEQSAELDLAPGRIVRDAIDGPQMLRPVVSSAAGTNIASFATPFVGREREVGELVAMLDEYRLVTVTGMAGVGKTRVVLEAATRVASTLPGGAWLVDLDGLTDLDDDVSRVVAEVIDLDAVARPVLLVLDGCDGASAAIAAYVREALVTEGLGIVATSLQALGVSGERQYRLGPMAVPLTSSAAVTVDEALALEAVQLFVQRARHVDHDYALTAEDAPAVVRICQHLDGLPLAIGLAAARLQVLSPTELVERLDDSFGLLTSGSRTTLPRHKTFRSLLAWSYDLLSPEEQLLAGRASIFAGDFALSALEQVASGDGLDQDAILDLLSGIVDKSFAARDPARGRFLIPSSIRRYTDERMRIQVDEMAVASLRARYLEWAFGVVDHANITVLDTEATNLRGALHGGFGLLVRPLARALAGCSHPQLAAEGRAYLAAVGGRSASG